MKIDLYITYYELSHLQSFIPINSKTFWMFDEILSIIEEEIDKEVMKPCAYCSTFSILVSIMQPMGLPHATF